MKSEHPSGCIVGIDLGATKLFAGIADPSGHLISTRRVATHTEESAGLSERIGQIIDALLEEAGFTSKELIGIGIGAPGVVDEASDALSNAPGLREDGLIRLAEPLRSRFQSPVYVENDVNAALLGEVWKGALKGGKNAALISVGTGIGVGLLLNGEIYRGAHQAAGEMGYWLIGSLGPIVRADGYGPLEAYAAGPGIAKRYIDRLRETASFRYDCHDSELTSESVADAALHGDPVAREIWQETAEMIGVACANLCSLLDPEIIGIGGGVSRVDESLLLEPIRKIVHTLVPYPPDVVSTQLGDRAGVFGSILTVLQNRRSMLST